MRATWCGTGVVAMVSGLVLAMAASDATAQTVRSWTGAGGSAWLTTTNWDPTGTWPGNAPNAAPAGEGAATDIFSIAPANTASTIGINMGTLVAGGGVGLILGGIDVNKTQTTSVSIYDSSPTPGLLQINGATINGVANTLVRLTGSANLTLAGVSTGTFGLRLGNTNGIFDVASGRNLTLSGTISEPSATPSGFTKTNTGTLTLNSANSFSGPVTVSAGSLILNNSSALGTGTLTLSSSAAQVSLGTAGVDISRPLIVTGGGGGTSGSGLIHFTPGSGTGTWSGAMTINGNPTAGGLFGSGGGELVLAGAITSASAIPTVRTGVVTLASASNSFSEIGVTLGALKLGVDNGVPTAARIQLTNSANLTFSSTFSLNGYNQTLRAIYGSGSSASILNDGASAKTLTLTGSTINSIPNTVISKSGTGTMTFANGVGGMGLTFDTGASTPVIDATTGVTISSTLTSANGLTKVGAGALVLSANNESTLAGTVTGSAGTLVARAVGSLGTGTIALSGSPLQFDTVGGTYANPITTSTATQITSNNVAVTLSGPITIAGDLTLRGQGGGSNQFTLSNANAITSSNNSNVTFNVDSSQTHTVSGIISLGTGTVSKGSTASLTLSNAGNSFGGLTQAGSGGITISANGAQGGGSITFATGGSGAITFSNVSGTVANAIASTGGTGGITKTGASTMTLTGSNTYTGSTIVGGGTLAFAADQSLIGNLVIGSSAGSTTTAGIDLAEASGTFAALTVQTNSTTPNVITVGSGRTLAITGNATIGANTAANTATAVTVTGPGSLIVTNTADGGSFVVGNGSGGTNYTSGTADFSGLGSFTANLSSTSSIIRIGDANVTSNSLGVSTMKLAATSTITSATVAVGINAGNNALQSLLLGSGSQVINASTLAVGQNTTSANSIRSSGLLEFAGATGSLTVRGQDGVSAAALVMNKSSSQTSVAPSATFNVAGHQADLLFSTVDMTVISINTAGAVGAYASTLSFDRGTLTSGTTNLGARTAGLATSGSFTATANIGSASNFTNAASLGAVTMAAHSGSNCTIRGILNITGTDTSVSISSLSIASNTAGVAGGVSAGTVAISGGATTVAGGISLASSAGFGTVNGTLSLTGGSLTVGGDITQAGTVTGSLALAGGVLDMTAFAIGSLASPISAGAFTSGTLRNLGEYNGGGQLTKSGAGTLVLAGSSAFTGGVLVTGGTLTAGGISALGSGTLSVGGGVLDLAGLAVNNTIAVSQGSVVNASAYAGTQTVSGPAIFTGTVGGAVNVGPGGLLKGSNTIFTGTVGVSGTHSPGSSPGLQTFTAGLGYSSAATLVWELSANTAAAIDRGILYDAIDATTSGSLSIDPSATISLVFNAPLADSTPSAVNWTDTFWDTTHEWLVVDVVSPVTWNQVTFGNVLVGNDATGASLATARPGSTFSVVSQGGDLYVTYVPEPAVGLLGIGVLVGGLWLRGRVARRSR